LDRFYAFSSPCGAPNSHIAQYEILGDCAVFDHLPVIFRLELSGVREEPVKGSRYKVNNFYLDDKMVVDQLGAI
jgi:hypothetical protein